MKKLISATLLSAVMLSTSICTLPAGAVNEIASNKDRGYVSVSYTAEKEVAFEINTHCQTTNTKITKKYKYSSDDIDYFYTNFNNQGYLVSIEEATGLSFRWRYEYPKTGQKQSVHIAKNYKIEEVIKTI